MINEESFILYDKLVKENHYYNLFDISIIFHANECLGVNEGIKMSNKEFKKICNEVKRLYLKYDYELDDALVEKAYNDLKERGEIK